MADALYQSETAIELAAAWKKAIADFLKVQENLIKAQIEISTKTREISERWLDRMQSNANFTSEFVSKLAAAGTMRGGMAGMGSPVATDSR